MVLHEIGESYYNEYIPAVITHLDELGLVSISGGAKTIFPPGSQHEQPLIVQKSDGGFGYDSTDVSAIWYRLFQQRADWIIYVTDAGQGPHFELVFDVAKATKWKPEARLDHMPFGLVQRLFHIARGWFSVQGEIDQPALTARLVALLNEHGVEALRNGVDPEQIELRVLSVDDAKEEAQKNKLVLPEGFGSGDHRLVVVTLTELAEESDAKAATEALSVEGADVALALQLLGPVSVKSESKAEKFKTRSGETVRLVDLLDEAVERMLRGLKRRAEESQASGQGASTMSDEEMANAARVLGYSAVKYADLKGNRTSNYVFSYDRMLDEKGNTAVYLLYAGARISAILRRVSAEDVRGPSAVDARTLMAAGAAVELLEPEEIALGSFLLRFPEKIELTLEFLLPNTLCEYVFEVCVKLTNFYAAKTCKVKGSAKQDQRVLLLLACQAVMKQCFSLLGLGHLEKI